METHESVRLITQTDVPFVPLDHLGAPGIETAFAISAAATTQLGGGFSHFTGGGLREWTLHYDEVLYVIRGKLTITTADESVVANVGEAILIQQDTTVGFFGESDTLVFVALTPRDWDESEAGQAEIARHRPV